MPAFAPRSSPVTQVVHIAAEHGSLTAELTIPSDPRGVIILARTNAARRRARANQALASALHRAHFATLAFDLLTPGEELADDAPSGMRDDLALLARRLIEAVDWLADQPRVCGLDVGIFGEGPAGPAAFVAACVRPRHIASIVSFAARLDAAQPVLARVQTPSLIIVSGNDEDEVRSNDIAFQRLRCPKQLVRVGVDRFTTTGETDKEISELAFHWFSRIMTPSRAGAF